MALSWYPESCFCLKWRELSYTHQREHVEAIDGAKKAETRARRIEGTIRVIKREVRKREA